MSHVISNYHTSQVTTLCCWGEIVKELLENGAHPLAFCIGPTKFTYRGNQRKKVNAGNSWSAAEVISKAFEVAVREGIWSGDRHNQIGLAYYSDVHIALAVALVMKLPYLPSNISLLH